MLANNNIFIDKIQETINQEIYKDFELFIKEQNVYKNWFRTIHPKTCLWTLEIKIP